MTPSFCIMTIACNPRVSRTSDDNPLITVLASNSIGHWRRMTVVDKSGVSKSPLLSVRGMTKQGKANSGVGPESRESWSESPSDMWGDRVNRPGYFSTLHSVEILELQGAHRLETNQESYPTIGRTVQQCSIDWHIR
jgi:hypothetical protein